MAIRFHCEACEARVKVPGGSEGRKVKCPRCGHMQRVPQHAQAQPVAAGAVTMPEELHDADGSGSYSAQVEDAGPAPQVESRTSTKHGPRKGGLDAGDSLGELAKR